MAYSQNTITSANAANVYAGILEGLLATAGWTQIDATVPAAGQVTHVWKSSGASNLCHYDWYLAITWTSVGTENTVRIIAGAAYDLATHRLSLMPLGQQAIAQAQYIQPVTGDVCGYYDVSNGVHPVDPNGYWDTSNASAFSNSGAPWHQFVIPSSAFGYWASVTLDHFTVFTTVPQVFNGNNQGNGMYHVGTLALDADYAALEWTAPNPLMQKSPAYNPDYGYGFIPSIIPPAGETRTVNTAPSKNYGAKLPLLSDDYFDAFAWRPGIFVTTVSGNGGTPVFLGTAFDDGLLVGQAIDWYAVYGGSIGDTVEIDGATYVLSGPCGTNNPSNNTTCIAVLVEA